MQSNLSKSLILVLFMSPLFTGINAGQDCNKETRSFDDQNIVSSISHKFKKDNTIDASGIHIVSSHGYVELSRNVNSDYAYKEAIALAYSVDSVNEVNTTFLKVKQHLNPFADATITGKINAKLLKEKFFGDKAVKFWSVQIESRNGMVFLTGTVDSNDKKENIIKIAEKVAGKQSVNAEGLKVT